MFQKDSNNIRS